MHNRFRAPRPVFLGSLHVTAAARALLTHEDVLAAVSCQLRGDWGEAPDWAANDLALEQRNRVRAIHRTDAGELFWVVTDVTRGATMIALPSEYE